VLAIAILIHAHIVTARRGEDLHRAVGLLLHELPDGIAFLLTNTTENVLMRSSRRNKGAVDATLHDVLVDLVMVDGG